MAQCQADMLHAVTCGNQEGVAPLVRVLASAGYPECCSASLKRGKGRATKSRRSWGCYSYINGWRVRFTRMDRQRRVRQRRRMENGQLKRALPKKIPSQAQAQTYEWQQGSRSPLLCFLSPVSEKLRSEAQYAPTLSQDLVGNSHLVPRWAKTAAISAPCRFGIRNTLPNNQCCKQTMNVLAIQ